MPHAIVAHVHQQATVDKEEGDVGHVAADVELAQPAQDDGNEEEGDVEHVAADARLTQPTQHKKNHYIGVGLLSHAR
jgi:hypothetical protein